MRTLRPYLIPLAVALFAVSGCTEDEGVKKSEVTHEDRESLRTRVAFITQGKAAWFFRLTGPADLVKQQEAAFDSVVKNVSFDDGKKPNLVIAEPNGWKADPWQVSAMTNGHTTSIRFKAKPKELEILVTELSKNFDLVDNMHRWQKKINAPLVETFQEAEAMVKRETVNGLDIGWVEISGLGVHSVSKPAEAVAQNKKDILPGMGPQKLKQPRGLPFTYKAPEKWVQKPPRQFVLDAFEISDGKETGELTISQAMGTVGANISRWRDQVQLPKLDDETAEQTAKKRKLAGFDAFYVDLDSPNGPAGKNRILGVVIPMGRQTLFVKFTGPRDLLGQQKAAFDAFLDTFQREGK